jgi:hypothetical protein
MQQDMMNSIKIASFPVSLIKVGSAVADAVEKNAKKQVCFRRKAPFHLVQRSG